MSSPEVTTLGAELAELLQPLDAKHELILEELKQVREREQELTAQLRQIEKVKRAAGLMEAPAPAASRNGSGPEKKKGTSVAAWREEEITKLMSQDPTVGRTVNELAEILGWNKATTSLAVNQARANGRLRLAGKKKGGGQGHANARVFRVVV